MIFEWHTGNQQMHRRLYRSGQFNFNQYRVTGDAGEVAVGGGLGWLPRFLRHRRST